jgi:peptidoglycan/LPS O-acetylase OafA/YrhL
MADQKVEFANALRGLAALSVIVSHYLGVFWVKAAAIAELTGMSRAPVPIPTMAELALSFPLKWAPFGVALFFVISGFEKPSHRLGRRIAMAIRSAEVEVRQIA